MSSNANCIFDLPELAQYIALHLPQGSLNRCIRVSKTWHAIFIPYLWRTFNDEQTRAPALFNWSQGVARAILTQQSHPENLEWYKDVYRRHAKYIRHLTIQQPVILDACLEDAFRSSSPRISYCDSDDGDKDDRSAEASSSTGTTTPAPAAIPRTTTGRSLLTNLESLTINVTRKSIATYFMETLATGEQPVTSASFFGTGNTSTFGGFNGSDNNNNSNGNEATTDPVETTPPKIIADPEKLFIAACQSLILCNPRLRTLQCFFSPQILEGLLSSPHSKQALLSLKNLSVTSPNGRIPAPLPPNVTNLSLASTFATHTFSSSINGDSSPPIAVYEGLEALNVSGVRTGSELIYLLNQAPSIKTLSLICNIASFGFGFASTTGLGFGGSPSSILPWPLSRVTVLKCQQRRGAFSVSGSFNGIFQAFPQLVEYHDDSWYPSIAQQLIQHCPLLEVIRIGQDPVLYNGHLSSQPFGHASRIAPRRLGEPLNDSVSELLSSISRLRIVDIPYELVTAQNILEKPWVCLDLEELSLQIVQLPYLTKEQEERVQRIYRREIQIDGCLQPDSGTYEDVQLIDLSERCISTRRAVMAQLSKLTSLKYLSLSPDHKVHNELFEYRLGATLVYKSERDGRSYIRYNDVLPDTLHLRLDSGLEQLASLTQLEYLSFESIDHQMGTAEVEWMAKQFPRLKEMRGLATENYVGMEPDPKNDALVALMRRLRPNVRQGQSFGGYATSTTGFGTFSAFGTASSNLFS
ncbi:hypothetical protein BGW39_007191 [Mortierella sp. 14UC]|nr:hypothetical protein BGW39_007191 [Mortierella sp. 14UC]